VREDKSSSALPDLYTKGDRPERLSDHLTVSLDYSNIRGVITQGGGIVTTFRVLCLTYSLYLFYFVIRV
jgi:hypothetical protein